MGRGEDQQNLKAPPRRNPFRQKILDIDDIKDSDPDTQETSPRPTGYFKYFTEKLEKEDISLVERVFAENNLSEEERHLVAKSLDLEEIKLVDQFFQIQFDGSDNVFHITKNIKTIGGRDDHEHYTTPSQCILHQKENSSYIEKIWLSDGERSRSPERGPSRVIVALDKNGEPKEEGTYSGHSWSFRHRLLGWHNGQYLSPSGLAMDSSANHEAPGENTPWPWLRENAPAIVASRAENTTEAGVLYYLNRLEDDRTVDRPFKSEKWQNEERSEAAIAKEIKSALRGSPLFGNRLSLRNAIDINEEEVREAINTLLERGLIESIRVGPPWKRYSIYKITPEAYLGGFYKAKTQEEKWQESGAFSKP